MPIQDKNGSAYDVVGDRDCTGHGLGWIGAPLPQFDQEAE